MSTIKTTFIQHPSAAEPSIELSADGTIVLPLSDLEDLANVSGSPSDGQVLTFNATSGNWEAKDLNMKEKRIERFTGSGTWTVPAGVTYAIAYMTGAGGGGSSGGGGFSVGGDGGTSSVDFASGLVSASGGTGSKGFNNNTVNLQQAVPANSGRGGGTNSGGDGFGTNTLSSVGTNGTTLVAGAEVTPGADIDVVVGAGGAAGTPGSPSGVAGAAGYVYIEYYEEV